MRCGDGGSRPGQHTCSSPALDAPPTAVPRRQTLRKFGALLPGGNCSEVFPVDLFTNTMCCPKGISTAKSHKHGSMSENLGSVILKKGFFYNMLQVCSLL